MIIFCKDSRFLADNGKKTALSHTFLEFLAAPRTLRATNKFVLQKEGLVQQLEYVAISRATDTATIISNNVKKEGSPLHPEQNVKEDKVKVEKQPTIPEQLISHLKSQGINVLNRDAMAEFLKTHKLEHLQQYINKYDLPKGELSTLSSALMTKYDPLAELI